MTTPTLAHEAELWAGGYQRVVGIDECGRGAWCGPVVSAAVILPRAMDVHQLAGVRDSKQMTTLARSRLAPLIIARAIAVGIGAASRAEIEQLNIQRATALAMRRALARVGMADYVLIDGLPIRNVTDLPSTALIGGDQHCLSIACASVVAKHCRDTLLIRLAQRYPHYGWETNKGYGTARHSQALLTHGMTPHHRRTFAPIAAIAQMQQAAHE